MAGFPARLSLPPRYIRLGAGSFFSVFRIPENGNAKRQKKKRDQLRCGKETNGASVVGTEIFDDGEKSYMSGGTIIGCGVRTFTSKATNSGGIVGTATADTNSAYIKSCYAANIYLNGENNGGIVGADGKYKAHRIVYCLVDNANGYAVVGGDRVRSISKRMVLSVPADSGLTVDGVLSVLNASGSGFDNWERSENKNGGYPYPSKITF